MFALDCMKNKGQHLGTCIDRFYFGSCCSLGPNSGSVNRTTTPTPTRPTASVITIIDNNDIGQLPTAVPALVTSSTTRRPTVTESNLNSLSEVPNTTSKPFVSSTTNSAVTSQLPLTTLSGITTLPESTSHAIMTGATGFSTPSVAETPTPATTLASNEPFTVASTPAVTSFTQVPLTTSGTTPSEELITTSGTAHISTLLIVRCI